jgi:iron-sulfur cluster repair protein YtfE (RIC family)
MTTDGRLKQSIKQKRTFLRQTMKDYSAGGNDMLDDIEALLEEAKAEITQRLDVANCLKEDGEEEAWRKESLSLLMEWFEKWFGKP